MKFSITKNSITFLFLALFISMKMAGVHAFFHTDEEDDHATTCVVCEYTIAHNLTPILYTPVQEYKIEPLELHVYKQVFVYHHFNVTSSIAVNQLFSRPPPFLLS